jgi:hypothetical protein
VGELQQRQAEQTATGQGKERAAASVLLVADRMVTHWASSVFT